MNGALSGGGMTVYTCEWRKRVVWKASEFSSSACAATFMYVSANSATSRLTRATLVTIVTQKSATPEATECSPGSIWP